MTLPWTRFTACAIVVLAGCNSSSGGGTPDMTSAPDLAPAMITVSYTLVDDVSGSPVVGAKVCLYPALTNCATSNMTGAAVLAGVPASSQQLIAINAQGYVGLLETLSTGTTPILFTTGLVAGATAQAIGQALGLPIDLAAKGAVHLQTGPIPGGVSGITFTATNAGDGPFYGNASKGYDKTTTKTTDPLNDAVFVNVPPTDDLEVTYHATTACTNETSSWAGAGPGIAKVKVVAGYLTNVSMHCTP